MNRKTGGYEAHMTFAQEHARTVQNTSEISGWVFSMITGCPLLGPGTYCYLTNYSKDEPAKLREEMAAIMRTLVPLGVETLRSKIEHIVFDTKTGVNEL